MIGIVKLNIELQLITTQEEVDIISEDTMRRVAEKCFVGLHRRVLKADVIDIELTDDDIDVIKLLDTRKLSGEVPVTMQAGEDKTN